MKLTLLTAACHRPAAWELCELYIQRQTVQPFQMLVIDDDEPQTVCSIGQEYYYRPELRGAGGADSLKNKVKWAIAENLIKGDAVVFWENDDRMAPTWLEFCADKLQRYDMIGEGKATYYNVLYRFWNQHNNMAHASLCSTAVRTSLLPVVAASCNTPGRWIDDMLWHQPVNKMVFDPIHNSGKPLVVGIKGMPGRAGIGLGHDRRLHNAHEDPNLEHLKWLIGEDASLYEQYYKPK